MGILDPTLESLSPRDVANWLRMRGFSHSGGFGEYGAIFQRVLDDREQEVILPTASDARDFVRRMAELVEDLSGFESRSASEVLTDLAMAPFDVVKVRSPESDAYGSIRFSAGVALHDESRNIMLSSANSAASPIPRRSWRGRHFDETADYIESVRLGQTQRGSFILTVLSPWDFVPGVQHSLELSDMTFGRRVTRALASALKATDRALRQSVVDGEQPLVDSYQSGVTSNFCAALARLAMVGDGIDISLGWSPSKPDEKVVKLSLRREDAAVLDKASKALANQEAEPDFRIEGVVTGITEPSHRFDGDAVVETVLAGTVRKVRMKFGSVDRTLIYEAAQHKRWITVTGDLQRQGQRLTLQNPKDIAVIEPDDDAPADLLDG
ncbi:hypothetical protein GFL57_28220 [Rhizobium leguminosarum bv. viciae]|nr:hypothetical protein [Rhizobium leguminosarum bv. viciae]